MKRLALLSAILLVGCSTLNVKQIAEKSDTDASLAYAAVATAVNAYEAKPGVTAAQTASAEGLKLKAWEALMIERQAYAAGQTIDLTALASLVAQAKALGN